MQLFKRLPIILMDPPFFPTLLIKKLMKHAKNYKSLSMFALNSKTLTLSTNQKQKELGD